MQNLVLCCVRQVKFKIASCHCAVNENRLALAEVHSIFSNLNLHYDDLESSRNSG